MKTIREKFEELEDSKLESTLKDYLFLVQSKLEENPDTTYEDIRPVEFKFYKTFKFNYSEGMILVNTYYAYDPFMDMYVGKLVSEGEVAHDLFKVLNEYLEYDYTSVKYIYSTSIDDVLEKLNSAKSYFRNRVDNVVFTRKSRLETHKFYLKSKNIIKK